MPIWSDLIDVGSPKECLGQPHKANRIPFLAYAVLALCAACAANGSGQIAATNAPLRPAAPYGPSTTKPPMGRDAQQQAMQDEADLARQARLETILRVALVRNPELSEAHHRVRAARTLVPSVSRLPDPEFEYQLWAAPLDRPYALGDAEMHMFGLRQAIPAPGSLDAREKAAAERARMLQSSERTRALDLALRVRHAFAQYYRSQQEYRIHLEHAAVAEQVLELVRAIHRGGRGSQQDVLHAQLEVTRLHGNIVAIQRERDSVRALLNALMTRPLEAPLGPPAQLERREVDLRFESLERQMDAHRPELEAGASSIRMREGELDEAESNARFPTFMVGIQYMYMPPSEAPHNYGVMFSMSLPWLNPRYGDEIRAAEANIAAERAALASTQNTIRYELYAAVQRLRAVREALQLLERDVVPQAERSFELSQAAYRAAQGDALPVFQALRALLDVRTERERVLADLALALSALERAVGAPIPAIRAERKNP